MTLPVRRARRVWFVRPSYLIWLVVPMILLGIYVTYGMPHLRWSYSWRDDNQGFSPFANRFYLRCTYLGFGGGGRLQDFTIHHPPRGRCPILRFAKDKSNTTSR